MGRQLRRVPLDFEWPINQPWRGYINPYSGMKCRSCDGGGYNPEVKKLSDDWYDFAGTGRKWCYAITQDEVDALVERGRLHDLTSTFVPGEGWKRDSSRPHPTAEQVNQWSQRGVGHDAINQSICVEARARRLGIWGEDGRCRWCRGHGDIFPDESFRQLQEDWQHVEPPTGEGFQMWETVSEGSPISPVFASAEELARWLVDNPRNRCDAGTSYEQWLGFILGPGWAPSMIGDEHGLRSGVQAVSGATAEKG